MTNDNPLAPTGSKITDEKNRQDATVVEYVAQAIEKGLVPEGQASDMLKQALPNASEMNPQELRSNIRDVIDTSQAQDNRGTLFLLGQIARAAGAKGLG